MKNLVAGSFLTLAALLSLFEISPPSQSGWALLSTPAAEILLLLTLAGLIAINVRIYFSSQIRPSYSRSIKDIHAVPAARAYELQKLAGKTLLNARQARLFTLALLEPAEVRQRVVEQYAPTYRTLEQEVTIEAQVPNRIMALREDTANSMGMADRSAPALFPVIVLPKGSFSDNFEVLSSDGALVPTLAYKEYLQLVAGILRLFLRLAFGFSTIGPPPHFPSANSGSAESDVLHLEHRALCEIIRRADANAEVKRILGVSPVSDEAKDIAGCLEKLNVDDSGKVYLNLAAELVRKLSLHYAMVASIPFSPGGRILVRYRRALIPELELSPDTEGEKVSLPLRGVRRVKGWLRILFSTRPVSVTVSLDNSWTCQSYHVRVYAPEGLYLAKQKLVATSEYLASRAKGAPTLVHYRFRRRLGQSYAHFYGRFFPIPIEGSRRPKLQLDFFEVPPGSDFRAAIAGGACFALVWLVGYVMSRAPDPGTDAPAFLLLFPGVAASWLGFDAPTHRLFEGTLAARLSLVLTTVTSLAASGLFMTYRADLVSFERSMRYVAVLGVTQLWWAVLVAVSCMNSLYMAYRWWRQSWRFKYLAARRDPDVV
jgi:hypothetical protein